MNKNTLNFKKQIVVLTGAGISAESGLKTFRDENGLWEGHRFEEVATPEAFAANPKLVHEFYNLRRASLKEVQPNAAHFALAELEQKAPGSVTIITQNVDDLHERAGSKNVIHMHGELRKVRCFKTGEVFTWLEDLTTETAHPRNSKSIGTLRPHICWFGEVPFHMDQIQQLCQQADLFVAIGTSGVVYPAAALVGITADHCHRVLINKEPSDNAELFSEHYIGLASEQVPRFLKSLKV